MSAQVTIITPSYNKPALFAQCAESVLSQTYQDWVWWVVFNCETYPWEYSQKSSPHWTDSRFLPIWYHTHWQDRDAVHIPTRIVNWLYPKVQTPYIYFLADDDLIDQDALEMIFLFMHDAKRAKLDFDFSAVYGRCEVQNEQPDGSFTTSCWCYEGQDVGLNTSIDPDCRLDGGQVLHTKALWDTATADGWQLSDKKSDAGHNDGQLLSRLAQFTTFYYVPQRIVTHRRTHLSESHKPQL